MHTGTGTHNKKAEDSSGNHEKDSKPPQETTEVGDTHCDCWGNHEYDLSETLNQTKQDQIRSSDSQEFF